MQGNNISRGQVLLLLDRLEYNTSFEKFLKDKGFRTRLIPTLKETWERVAKDRLDETDVAFVHKDLGDENYEGRALGISADDVVAQIHERAPHIRIVVISGEFPDGEKHVVQEMKADAYTDPGELKSFGLKQAQKGPATPQEQERRGKTVEKPPWFSDIEGGSLPPIPIS